LGRPRRLPDSPIGPLAMMAASGGPGALSFSRSLAHRSQGLSASQLLLRLFEPTDDGTPMPVAVESAETPCFSGVLVCQGCDVSRDVVGGQRDTALDRDAVAPLSVVLANGAGHRR